jgi:putative ABC transport system ATP-binding protein
MLDITLKDIQVKLPNGSNLFKISHLHIPFGEHILIQGKSGQGKTTLLHLIAGLLNPNEGQVRIGSEILRDLDDNQRCEMRRNKMGVVFQKLNLLDHLTVSENILLTSKDMGDVLSTVGLSEKSDTRCSVLSLGEQQRVAVARILAQNIEIILADEPTSSLDAENAEFVIQALKKKAEGKTLIVVSHDERLTKHFHRVLKFSEVIR